MKAFRGGLIYISGRLRRDSDDPYSARVCGVSFGYLQSKFRRLRGKLVLWLNVSGLRDEEWEVLKEIPELRRENTLVFAGDMDPLKALGKDRNSDGKVSWEEIAGNAEREASKGNWSSSVIILSRRARISGKWKHSYGKEMKLHWEGVYLKADYIIGGRSASLTGWPDGKGIRYIWKEGKISGTGYFDRVTERKITGSWRTGRYKDKWFIERIAKNIDIDLEADFTISQVPKKKLKGDIRAVVIGVSKYDDRRIRRLKYAAKDAKAFASLLKNCGVEPDAIAVLDNEKATKGNIKSLLYNMGRSGGKVLYIFFSCHGIVDRENSKLYLACYDIDKANLSCTGYGVRDLERAIYKDARQEVVVCFLDACHSGGTKDDEGFKRKTVEGLVGIAEEPKSKNITIELEDDFKAGRRKYRKPRVVILTSCKANQVSLEDDEYKHSLYTYFLLEGLKGRADENEDGKVSIEEIDDYLFTRVKRKTRRLQVPMARYSFNWSKTTWLKTHIKRKVKIIIEHPKSGARVNRRQIILAGRIEGGSVNTITAGNRSIPVINGRFVGKITLSPGLNQIKVECLGGTPTYVFVETDLSAPKVTIDNPKSGIHTKMIISANIKHKKANGKTWDAGFGKSKLPDPFFEIYTQAKDKKWVLFFKSKVLKDTVYPKWKQTCTIQIKTGMYVKIKLWDKDLKQSDVLGECLIKVSDLQDKKTLMVRN